MCDLMVVSIVQSEIKSLEINWKFSTHDSKFISKVCLLYNRKTNKEFVWKLKKLFIYRNLDGNLLRRVAEPVNEQYKSLSLMQQ
jgi:hypothetical protein